MTNGRLAVFFGAAGAVIGSVADLWISRSLDWGFSLATNILLALFTGVIFFVAARAGLGEGASVPKRRVEQVTGKKRKLGDCYESIVVEQEDY